MTHELPQPASYEGPGATSPDGQGPESEQRQLERRVNPPARALVVSAALRPEDSQPPDRFGGFQMQPLSWASGAKCLQAEPETFFPEKGGSTREAKRICGQCAVKRECLEYALANDERFGIWGGLSERERRKLKRLAR